MAFLMLGPGLASASHGGPELCDVVGWDPVDRKVFVARHDWSESAAPPALVYFELDGKQPCRAVVVPWSRDMKLDETVRAQRWKKLRTRLEPLVPSPVALVPKQRVIVADTLTGPYEGMPRFRVEISSLGMPLHVTTYARPDVFTLRLYEIPGRRENLAILSFTGIPWEAGYETQVPIVLGASCPTPIQVEWKQDP
jgi:hypothetical protein